MKWQNALQTCGKRRQWLVKSSLRQRNKKHTTNCVTQPRQVMSVRSMRALRSSKQTLRTHTAQSEKTLQCGRRTQKKRTANFVVLAETFGRLHPKQKRTLYTVILNPTIISMSHFVDLHTSAMLQRQKKDLTAFLSSRVLSISPATTLTCGCNVATAWLHLRNSA